MLNFRKETDYAIQFLLYLAKQPKLNRSLKAFAQESGISFYFMQKIARKLVRCNVIKAEQGVKGGYRLKVKAKNLSLYQLVEMMEGGVKLLPCVWQIDEKNCACQAKKCAVRAIMCQLNKEIVKAMDKIKVI